MATEIFVEPELQELEQREAAADWFELASELGLSAQISLADKSEERKAPPYMYIDPKTHMIIQTLCPCKVDYAQYQASTIPLDVMQEIKKCIKNGWYEKIHIYYDNISPDPFVVGEYAETSNSWRKHYHLIARWGAELVPMEQLEDNAVARLRSEAKGALLEMKAKVEVALSDVDIFCKQMLAGKDAPRMSFTVGSSQSFIPF